MCRRPTEIDARSWRPLLRGAVRQQAIATVKALAAVTSAPRRRIRQSDPSLAGGWAGLAVFHTYLARAGFDATGFDTAERLLERAEHAVATQRLMPGLFSGFAGVAWSGAHIRNTESPDDDRYEDIDGAVLQYLDHVPTPYGYDLVNGLVGFGVYALERGAAAIMLRVLDHLEHSAEHHQDRVTWATPTALLPIFPGKYNLGVAHGVPGVIGLLAAMLRAGVARRRVRPLLRGAVTWLLDQRLPEGESAFLATSRDGEPSNPNRAAWCYGDPGIAGVLRNAGVALSDRGLANEALNLARHAADRLPDRCGVDDAGLCHGAAGLGHIFNRLYQSTGDRGLAKAARFWIGRCLELRAPGQGIAGYRALTVDDDGTRKWAAEAGLLTGAAGVGLALLAAVTSIDPAWDRMLLLSMMTGQAGGRTGR